MLPSALESTSEFPVNSIKSAELVAFADSSSLPAGVVKLEQYMRPTKKHMPVSEFVTPRRFQPTKASNNAELQALFDSELSSLPAGVDVVTLGQYMRPTKKHMAVSEFVTPQAFAAYQREADAMGFLYTAAGPMIRSSYKAGEFYLNNVLRGRDQEQPRAAVAGA